MCWRPPPPSPFGLGEPSYLFAEASRELRSAFGVRLAVTHLPLSSLQEAIPPLAQPVRRLVLDVDVGEKAIGHIAEGALQVDARRIRKGEPVEAIGFEAPRGLLRHRQVPLADVGR